MSIGRQFGVPGGGGHDPKLKLPGVEDRRGGLMDDLRAVIEALGGEVRGRLKKLEDRVGAMEVFWREFEAEGGSSAPAPASMGGDRPWDAEGISRRTYYRRKRGAVAGKS